MNCEKLFSEIEKREAEFIEIWKEVAMIESPTEHKAGVDAVGDYFLSYAKAMGWKTEVFEQKVSGNCVCITMNNESTLAPVTLSAHIDTVHPVGSFNPVVRTDDKYIYGPGVTDCKGGAVASLMAMTALKEIGFTSRPIRLILQSDEENSSSTSNKETINYICETAKDSIAFLNCESSRGDTAVLWRKGICRYIYEIEGKAVHASRCNEGASAIREAAYKIIELEKLKDTSGITCNCGLINGGTAENSVPDSCTFSAEIRFNNNQEWAEAEKYLKTVAETVFVEGTSCKFSRKTSRPAMEKKQANFDLLEKLNAIYQENGLPVLTARQSLGGSDAAEVTEKNIPCIDSIAVAGDKIHTPFEYGVLSSLKEAAKRIAAACYCL